MELYKRMRPTSLDDVLGQKDAVNAIKTWDRDNSIPHVVLLVGPTGTGKTTLARILASLAGCDMRPGNLIEVNCGHVRGIDSVREIDDMLPMRPMTGKARVWILDEVVQLPKATQQAFLKLLETTLEHAYFILCTTDTSGLLPTFLGRCVELQLDKLAPSQLYTILMDAQNRADEDVGPTEQAIARKADGSARKALQILEFVLALPQKDIPRAIERFETDEKNAQSLAQALMKKESWSTICQILKAITDSAETTRQRVKGYANAVLLSNAPQRQMAFHVIQAFSDPPYFTSMADVTAAAYSCCQNK